MLFDSPAIPRLDIPEYNWWNECLHGVARSGVATIFPQSIGLGATFDSDLVFRIGTAISDEARAMYNASVAKGYRLQYSGLTFWTPNINIFRDPRWGRGQETYGEDPYLTSVLSVSLVKGLQGDNRRYLKTAACAKHFAVHSGPEELRHEFNAIASPKDMYETYLPAFKSLVDAGVESVMCAYNRTNDEPCCASKFLLKDVLRKDWGFEGHIVSDCGALRDFYGGHNISADSIEAAALALKHGVNLNCGWVYYALTDAVNRGLVEENELDDVLATLLKTRFKLGLFDPPELNPYNSIPQEVINCDEHRELAREAATKSIVLLKNNGILPLKKDLPLYYITGPGAANIEVLIGNYYGVNNNMVTIIEGLASKIKPGSQLQYRHGCLLDRYNINRLDWTTKIARRADVTFVVLGLSGLLEGEEGASIASPNYGDWIDYDLPANQVDFLRALRKDNTKPIVAIITGGCPVNLSEIHELADAVLMVWYPGEEGGNAVGDIIFGDVSPSGRLPVTFPKSLNQLPAYEDYSMEGRTYRYMKKKPMYPFGYGLGYSSFEYSDLKLSSKKIKINAPVDIKVTVTNTSHLEGEEVIQLYITDMEASVRTPLYSLKDFKRISLKPGESKTINFSVIPEMLELINENGESILEPGEFKITIGGSLPGIRSEELGMPVPMKAFLKVK
ncbi:MAG: glycoside hydrolase family 3 C-terminal domain-containing protein [Bacteroidales bacterium]|nr:MAG: glycoside hydrolase family 3 C-terminal domain-containing protein [Bacteroidales bacterium]